jgi:uncharacterized membrane protein YfcA
MGLGGAEFRLPFLVTLFKKSAKKAVALNMSISLITILSSIYFRISKINLSALEPYLIVMVAIIVGSMTGAYFGAGLSQKISDALFKKVLLILLIVMGCILILEGFLPFQAIGIPFGNTGIKIIVAVLCGVGIGIISSLLGVAGGEVIIPTLILIFGLNAKLAGTVSLLISLPTILIGISRHAKNHMYSEKAEFSDLIIPMGVGSIVGARIGALLVDYISSDLLKLLLGGLLIFSAIKIFKDTDK